MNISNITLTLLLSLGLNLVPITIHAKVSTNDRKALAAYAIATGTALWWCSDNPDDVVRARGIFPTIKKHHIFGALQLVGIAWSGKCAWHYFSEGKNSTSAPLMALSLTFIGKVIGSALKEK